MAAQQYYQLGGFQPTLPWFPYDDNKLAQVIAGDSSPLRSRSQDYKAPIELVLGIKYSGASYILLTRDQAWCFVRNMGLPHPKRAPALSTDFESLSPIQFCSALELSKKLSMHKPKSKKGRVPTDNSQANKQFVTGEDGVHRGAFEHGRVFYRIVKNNLDVEKYSLKDASWTHSFRICSLTFNTWFMDQRNRQEKQQNPKLTDLGFTEVSIPDLCAKPGSSIHFVLQENQLLRQRSHQMDFKFGVTEILNHLSISLRLQHIFKDNVQPTDRPIILLVNGDEMTRHVVRNYGVDVSMWESGIKNLLGHAKAKVKDEPGLSRLADPRLRHPSHTYNPMNQSSYSRHGRHDDSDWYQRPRSRSRSPRREQHYDSYRPPGADKSRYSQLSSRPLPLHHSGFLDSQYSEHNPGTISKYAPVYVVDIQQMYIKLFQTREQAGSVADVARHLKLSSDVVGWCAGNDAHQIIDIWRSMVEGLTIDEQRALRSAAQLQPSAGPSQLPSAPRDSDDERDPNEITQISPTVQTREYDDESDYGDSDD